MQRTTRYHLENMQSAISEANNESLRVPASTCLACEKSTPAPGVEHPAVLGAFVHEQCLEYLMMSPQRNHVWKEYIALDSQTGKVYYTLCRVCAHQKHKVFLCINKDCMNTVCSDCLIRLIGPEDAKKYDPEQGKLLLCFNCAYRSS